MPRPEHVFVDDDGESVLIWRSKQPPPMPHHRSVVSSESLCSRSVDGPASGPRTSRDGGNSTSSSPAVPPGQLLPRGADGIDGVLQRARSAQQLYWSLQEQRLRREKKAAQRRLAKDLDDQREYKRMLRLAEYQEELVNVFGPTMQHIVRDSFFDDGTDPALRVVAAQRIPSTSVSSTFVPARSAEDRRKQALDAWRAARQEHQRACGADVGVVDDEMDVLALPLRADTLDTTVSVLSRQKEILNKALDYQRAGKRMPF